MSTPVALPILKFPLKKKNLLDSQLPRLSSPKFETTNLFNNFINGLPNTTKAFASHKLSMSNKHFSIHSPDYNESKILKSIEINSTTPQKHPSEYINEDQKKILSFYIPKFAPAKKSVKSLSIIQAFAANSSQGTVRTYNEDRVSIVINIAQNPHKSITYWPKCFLFAIYDGHGGPGCSDFLRDNLHNEIVQNEFFPGNPKLALQTSIYKLEKLFCSYSLEGKLDRSGSCLLVTLIVGKAITRDNTCYIANVGDCRLIKSSDNGKSVQQITIDHRPSNENEMKRIISNGGKVYQVKTDLPIEVPYRVFPGRLSVSRTIGDIEAKLPQFEGNPKVVIAEPDIQEIKLSDNDDFLLLGCDGIFDELTNEEIVDFIWRTRNGLKNIHEQAADAVDAVIKLAAYKESYDNLTAVLIGLKGFSAPDYGKLSEELIVNYARPTRVLSIGQLKKNPSYDGAQKLIGERKISVPSLKKLFISNVPHRAFKFPKITLPKKVTLLSMTKG